jgi:hypothetical protein
LTQNYDCAGSPIESLYRSNGYEVAALKGLRIIAQQAIQVTPKDRRIR